MQLMTTEQAEALLTELRRLNDNIEILAGVIANPNRTTHDAQVLQQSRWGRAKSAAERPQ